MPQRSLASILAFVGIACAAAPPSSAPSPAATPTIKANVPAPLVDADVDGDGFRDDSDDLCPGAPGERSGCPKAMVVIVCSKIVIAERIEFARNSDAVALESLPLLEKIAALLVEHTCVAKLRIVGHASTDEQGTEQLSSRRAQNIADVLAARGVDRTRLELLQAFGEQNPSVELTGRTTGFCHGHEASAQ